MPKQSFFRFIKRWRRYEEREKWRNVRPNTRGVYVLYRNGKGEDQNVVYIGVAGIGKTGGGIRGRLKSHNAKRKDWTHFSFFEVHDNVTREEIREMEILLLGIFRHDPRIQLANKYRGSKKLRDLRRPKYWKDVEQTEQR